MMEIDWSVGEILKTLKENSIDENTLVIFASDNGPALNFGKWGGSAGPLREGKGTMWEGGARVPCIMRWPEKISQNQNISKIAGTIDIFPTIAEIVGEREIRNKIDGVSLMTILNGEPNANPRDELFYYYGENLIAVRKGNWKLVFPHEHRSYINVEPGKNLHPGPYGKGIAGLELYDLEYDIGETTDLAAQFPEVVKDLEKLSESARTTLGDKLTDRVGSEAYTTICGVRPSIVKLNHSAIAKKIMLVNNAHEKYSGENVNALVNGVGGTLNFRDVSWQGFEAEDMVATIDLGQIQKVNSIEARFLQDQVVWIFLPQKVEIEHSLDGQHFESIYEYYPNNDFSLKQDIFHYKAMPENLKTRYIRVNGMNLNTCPDYHPGAGGPSWVFTDEIVIN